MRNAALRFNFLCDRKGKNEALAQNRPEPTFLTFLTCHSCRPVDARAPVGGGISGSIFNTKNRNLKLITIYPELFGLNLIHCEIFKTLRYKNRSLRYFLSKKFC
jgi:hypothetical protein